MARPGPPRTPTAVLALHGSWLAKRRVNEPVPAGADAAAPRRPQWLKDMPHAVACWNYHAKKLAALGTLTMLDRNLFERYCVLYQRWRDVVESVNRHGTIIPSKDSAGTITGYTERPEVSREMRLSAEMSRLETKLGLSAGDRAGMAHDVGRRDQAKTREEELADKYGS